MATLQKSRIELQEQKLRGAMFALRLNRHADESPNVRIHIKIFGDNDSSLCHGNLGYEEVLQRQSPLDPEGGLPLSPLDQMSVPGAIEAA
jgi:hypothetical protein